jgi:formyl-CoA transferase
VVIAANMDSLFRRLCAAMSQPELADDPRYATSVARGENQVELEAMVQAWAGEHTAAELDEILATAGVVSAPVATMADVFEDPHVRETGMLTEHEDPEIGSFRAPGVFPRFSAGSGEVRWTGAWEAGEDNQEVFGELLDRDADELAALQEAGVV